MKVVWINKDVTATFRGSSRLLCRYASGKTVGGAVVSGTNVYGIRAHISHGVDVRPPRRWPGDPQARVDANVWIWDLNVDLYS